MVNKNKLTGIAMALSANAAPAQRPAMNAVDVLRDAILDHVPDADAAPIAEALDRLARLVEAAKALLVVRSGPMLDDVAPYYRAVTELNDALAAVLGEGE